MRSALKIVSSLLRAPMIHIRFVFYQLINNNLALFSFSEKRVEKVLLYADALVETLIGAQDRNVFVAGVVMSHDCARLDEDGSNEENAHVRTCEGFANGSLWR